MSMSASEPDKLVKPAVTAKVAIKPVTPGPLLSSPLDAVPMKETEYDFPSVLLDRAQVARSERRAEQPKYNDDLAKVVARADIKEAMDRSDADDRLDKTKINALDGAIDFDAATFATNAAGKVSLADGAVKKSMIDPAALGSDDAVTIPKAEDPGKNALDSDIFETQEVNGDVGVTLKKGAITNEYVGEGAIDQSNTTFLKNLASASDLSSTGFNTLGTGFIVSDSQRKNLTMRASRQFSIGSGAANYLYIKDLTRTVTPNDSYNKSADTFDRSIFTYTNEVNKFNYDTPTENVSSIKEKFNLINFGYFSIILAEAEVTFTAAATAFMTISKDKVFNEKGYQGVYKICRDFQPFLLAESPSNPTTITSGLSHDEANGYRMQIQSSASGTYKLAYVLGNVDIQLLDTGHIWD